MSAGESTAVFPIQGYDEMVDIHERLSSLADPPSSLANVICGLGNLLMHGQSHVEYNGDEAALIWEALAGLDAS
jgi:hypothetical protein